MRGEFDEYVKEWLVLGPFFPDDLETDFLADVGGEANMEPRESELLLARQRAGAAECHSSSRRARRGRRADPDIPFPASDHAWRVADTGSSIRPTGLHRFSDPFPP